MMCSWGSWGMRRCRITSRHAPIATAGVHKTRIEPEEVDARRILMPVALATSGDVYGKLPYTFASMAVEFACSAARKLPPLAPFTG